MLVLGAIPTWESYVEYFLPYSMSLPALLLACLAFSKARRFKIWSFTLNSAWVAFVIVLLAAIVVVTERVTNYSIDGMKMGGWITRGWMALGGSPESTMWWRVEWFYSSLIVLFTSAFVVFVWRRTSRDPSVCSSCGYSKIGLNCACQCCPECGKAFAKS